MHYGSMGDCDDAQDHRLIMLIVHEPMKEVGLSQVMNVYWVSRVNTPRHESVH